MYIKLTRLDNRNTPIWLNAAFIVTIEPRKGGGATVVPIGDGLDYDVRESPEQVLKLLEGAPEARVVPVPPPRSLAPTPKDVSPEPEPITRPSPIEEAESLQSPVAEEVAVPSVEPVSAQPMPPAAAEPSGAVEPPAVAAPVEAAPSSDAASEEPPKPAKRTTRSRAKKSAAVADSEAETKRTTRKPRAKAAKTPVVEFPDDQVERLRKMAPGSLRKLVNTLVTQFKVSEPDPVVALLQERGLVLLEHEHVIWK